MTGPAGGSQPLGSSLPPASSLPSASAVPQVELGYYRDGGRSWPVLAWNPGPGWRLTSSAVLGGGTGPRAWWLNAMVSREYHHPDPARHTEQIAAALSLAGPGVGMLTAADVRRWVAAEDGGVRVAATVGLGLPTWAAEPEPAEPEPAAPEPEPTYQAGTINLLVIVPVPLTDAAAVNAVITATEAKTQALLEAGVPGTGTSSDAVCIATPHGGSTAEPAEPELYGGPRSRWGARIARAVHAAVAAGTADWLTGAHQV